jgi:glycolate oxidase
MMKKEEMINELTRLAGKENVLDSEMQIRLYEYDASLIRSQPDCIVFPTSTKVVSDILKYACANNIPVIARGAGTNLSGGSICMQGGICLVMTKMNRIIELDIENQRVVVEPGKYTGQTRLSIPARSRQ